MRGGVWGCGVCVGVVCCVCVNTHQRVRIGIGMVAIGIGIGMEIGVCVVWGGVRCWWCVCVCERERDGEQGTISLCYTINPCLSVLDIVVSLNPTLLIYPSPPFPLWYKLVP